MAACSALVSMASPATFVVNSVVASTSGRSVPVTPLSTFFGRLCRISTKSISKKESRRSFDVNALFGIKFGKDALDSRGAGIYGSQERDDFSASDCEHYFEYSGLLAIETSYDSLHALLKSGVHPADVLLLLASSEGDVPKIEELLDAGADVYARDLSGKTSVDRAQDDAIRRILLSHASSKVSA